MTGVRKESENDLKAYKMYIYIFMYMHIYFSIFWRENHRLLKNQKEKADAKNTNATFWARGKITRLKALKVGTTVS